jgi:hypothetical protein
MRRGDLHLTNMTAFHIAHVIWTRLVQSQMEHVPCYSKISKSTCQKENLTAKSTVSHRIKGRLNAFANSTVYSQPAQQ